MADYNSFPRLILNKEVCLNNISRMSSKIGINSSIRPHFKTHNSAMVGEWFRDAGINKITVTSPAMALKFIQNGWKDITIAFPFNPNWIDFINTYGKDVSLNLCIESPEVLSFLLKNLKVPAGIFLKIDIGSGRTGIAPYDTTLINNLLKMLISSEKMTFRGFLSHAGHTYHANGKDAIMNIYKTSAETMQLLKTEYALQFPSLISSYGDTPSCSLMPTLSHFDEYRPGNYVFYDLMQYYLGSCTFSDIALTVACQVVSTHVQRDEAVVHCGAVHLSKDFISVNDRKVYGRIIMYDDAFNMTIPDEEAFIYSLSQEHGIISAPPKFIQRLKPGQTIGIIPVHSCLTAYQLGYFY